MSLRYIMKFRVRIISLYELSKLRVQEVKDGYIRKKNLTKNLKENNDILRGLFFFTISKVIVGVAKSCAL